MAHAAASPILVVMLSFITMPIVAAPDAFITNQEAASVTVIDVASATVKARIPVAEGPVGVAINTDGSRVYLTHPEAGLISELDGNSHQVLKTMDVGGRPFGIVTEYYRGRSLLYVSDWDRDAVLVVDPVSGLVIDLLGVGKEPAGIVLDGARRRLYIANRQSDSVTVLDADRPRVLAQVLVGHAPFALALSPDGKRVYVGNVQSGDLSVIDADTLTVTDTVKVGRFPYSLAVMPDDTSLLVTNQRDNAIAVLDTTTLKPRTSVPVGRYPDGLALTGDGARALVTNWFDGTVSILDLTTFTEITRVPTEDGSRAFGRFIVGGAR